MPQRVQAFRRIIRLLGENKVSRVALMDVLLPMTIIYVREVNYHKNDHLMDTIVESISAMCKFMKWDDYYTQLKNQIKILTSPIDSHRIVVR